MLSKEKCCVEIQQKLLFDQLPISINYIAFGMVSANSVYQVINPFFLFNHVIAEFLNISFIGGITRQTVPPWQAAEFSFISLLEYLHELRH